MKEMGRKLLRVLLMVAMVIGLLPGMSLTALAWDGDPYANLLNTTTEVTFDGKQWYLIENNSTAVDAGTVTLLSKECVAASQYNSSNIYVEYASSTVKTAVDNYYTNSISSNVKTAIVDNKMFLLSKDQANAITKAEVRKCSQFSGTMPNGWWLCSPGGPGNSAAFVFGDDGSVSDSGCLVTKTVGVRPALKLDLSKVTFDSDTKTFTVGSATVDVTGVSLDKTTAQTIDVDGKVSFTATVAPDNATDKKVKWSGGTDTGAVKLYTDEACTTEVGSDATETLTVYAKGISAGSATVTCISNADSTKSASCDVTVNEAATEYPLWVGNTKVTSDNAANITGGETVTASYDPDSNTLTLNNYVSSACPDLDDWRYGICYKGTSVFTIVLEGTNAINALEEPTSTNKTIGIFSKNSIVIKGTGSLDVTARDQGIATERELTVESGTLTVTSNMSCGVGAPITIGEDVTSVVVTGGILSYSSREVEAIRGTVKNAVPGKGWTNKAGTQGEADIAVSTSGQNLSSYKKVQFPAAPLDPVASVTPYNGTPTEYTDFATAVTAWNDASDGHGYTSYGATLKLLTDVETNSGVKPNKSCLSDYPMTLDLNGYGIRYTGTTNNSVIFIDDGRSLKLIDSDTSRKHYITLDANGRGTAVSDTTSEGAIEVTGGYITGGLGTALYGGSLCGGGIYDVGTFIMEGGTIVGNTASDGGGVRITLTSSKFIMTGGTITGNKASTYGGGVSFGSVSVFNLSGGTITGNVAGSDGGGVYVAGSATFNLSGGAIIKDNLKGSDRSNVYLNNGRKITVTDTLTNSAPIGVTMAVPGVFTSSTDPIKASDYKEKFSSDDSTYSVMVTEENELKLGTHEHNFSYSASGATITATCGNSNCNLTDNKVTLTIVKPTLEIYHGTGEASATLTGLDAFNTATGKTVAATEIKYVGRSDTTYSESTTAPKNAGKYTAKITLTGVKTSEGEGKSVTASVDYEIAKKNQTVTAPTAKTGLTYNKQSQKLLDSLGAITDGNTEEGIKYKIGEAGDWGATDTYYKTDAGTYKVYYKVPGNDNYNEYVGGSPVEVTIAKAQQEVTAPDGKDDLVYTGSSLVLISEPARVITGNTSTPVEYKVDDGEWLTMLPTAVNVGNHNVYYRVKGNNNYEIYQGSGISVSIAKAANPATVNNTASVMKGGNTVDLAGNVTLNGATGEISYEISGEANGCTLSGSTLTSGNNTGSVTVNVSIAEDDNYNSLAATSITVTINDKQTQTITASDVTATYGDTGKSVSATTDGDGRISYAVKEGSGGYIGIMTDTGALTLLKAGTGTVVITASETETYAQATKEVTVTINKATPSITVPTAKTLTYSGSAQELVTEGSTTGGVMKYAVTTTDSAPTDETAYTIDTPKMTSAGTYYVWYKVDGGDNYMSVDPVSLPVSIAKAKATITDNQKPKAVAGLEADGTDHALLTAPAEKVTGYSVKYSLDGKTWSDSLPTGKEAGSYTVKVKYVADDQSNYEDIKGDDITVKITEVTYTAIKGNGQVWTKGSTSTADIEFERSVESAERTAFILFTKVQVDGNDVDASNYDKKEGSVIIKFKPAYLEKLSVGEHKVTAFFSDNHTASANFTVKAKSSDGGSSTPEKKTDNVVTCQMAGYPANYAWNEAAKACQPGYLDANGVFHSTARKSVVPGTYDRGLAGNVISLTVSAFFAIAAFFLLRKYK